MGFVDKLFECLTTKNYLGIPTAKEAPKEEVKPPAVKSEAVEVRRIHLLYLVSEYDFFLGKLFIFKVDFVEKLNKNKKNLWTVTQPPSVFFFSPRLRLQRRTEKTGGGEVLWETALTSTSPGTFVALGIFFTSV